MEKDKLKNIVEFISKKNNENEIKQILKNILKLLIGNNAKAIGELWFEKAEIKEDVNYYNLILALIDKLYFDLTEKENIDIEKTSKEIVEIITKSEFSSIYEQIRKLFFKIDPKDKYYYDIYYNLIFFGFKKSSGLNSLLIDILKELKKYNAISNSPFSQEISNFNYDNIDSKFLENLNEFIDSIMTLVIDKQKINEIIKKIKKY